MKHKKYIKALLIFVIMSFSIYNVKAQTYSWENPVILPYSVNTNYNSYYKYEMVYDNYGLHFVGIDAWNHLHYCLFDNNGGIISNYEFNNEISNVNGISITSHKGTIYIAATNNYGINIFLKTNDLSSSFEYKGTFAGGNYHNGFSDREVISMVGFGDNIYITWDNAGYLNYPVIG
jgi:hypothetical protein